MGLRGEKDGFTEDFFRCFLNFLAVSKIDL